MGETSMQRADVQQVVQQVAPDVAPDAQDRAPVSEGSNGLDVPTALGRDPQGRFRPGHRENLTTGMHTERSPLGLEHLQDQVDHFVRGCLIDEADPEDVPTRRMALIEYRARLHRRILQLDAALELRGLLDRRQKLRTQWLQQLGTLIEKARALDITLGLERRQRNVTESPQQWAERMQRERAEPEPSADGE
jgi:hypothetical protein